MGSASSAAVPPLPLELWRLVRFYCAEKDIFRQRLVSRQWCHDTASCFRVVTESTLFIHMIRKRCKFDRLTELSLRGCSSIIEPEIQFTFTKLTCLSLYGTSTFSDCHLTQLTNLNSLLLGCNVSITNHSVSLLTNLTRLDISWKNRIRDSALYPLTRLTTLSLDENEKITDRGLSTLSSLTSLSLRYNVKVTNLGVSRLANLTHLNLRGQDSVTDAGLRPLTALRHLNLRDNDCVKGRCLTVLTNLTCLRLDPGYEWSPKRGIYENQPFTRVYAFLFDK